MRKRIWFACLLAMSMTFAACGSKASTEVEQEDAATVQEDTTEAEEDTTEEENTEAITPEESQEETEEVQDPTVTAAPEDEEAQKNDTVQEAPQDVTPVNAQYQVYAGTYYDMNIYEATAEGGESDSYCQIEVSNITDQTFDFAVYQLTDGNKQMILDIQKRCRAHEQLLAAWRTKAVSEKDGTNLVFTFPDNWNALPKVVEMQVSGMDVLEGNSYVNNNVPGYEFG